MTLLEYLKGEVKHLARKIRTDKKVNGASYQKANLLLQISKAEAKTPKGMVSALKAVISSYTLYKGLQGHETIFTYEDRVKHKRRSSGL